MEQIKIVSKTNCAVSVSLPHITFRREWPSFGTSHKVDKVVLSELMYDPGFKYMIDNGMLYIEDMEVKKEFGIEPMDADAPVNIIPLEEARMKLIMTAMPIYEFKEAIKALTHEQLQVLVDYAIKNRYTDYERCSILLKVTGRDIMKAVSLEHDMEA